MTCKQLGFETGIPLCCAPYGYIKSHGTIESVHCQGHERRLTECSYQTPYGSMCSMDYAASACYNNTMLKDFGRL